MAEILVKLRRRMPEFKSDPNFVITPAIWRESEKLLKRCYKMLEITEYERTACVRKALAEVKPEVLAELTTPGSCKYTDPDAAIIVHDPEDEDNMGIDVEYLDCLPRHALHDIAGFGGASARHVFSSWDNTDDIQRQFHFRRRFERAEHTGRTTHVKFHFVHLGRRLNGNTAGVKSDTLADQYHRITFMVGALVLQYDQFRRFSAAACD